jgi:hypothetical protein
MEGDPPVLTVCKRVGLQAEVHDKKRVYVCVYYSSTTCRRLFFHDWNSVMSHLSFSQFVAIILSHTNQGEPQEKIMFERNKRCETTCMNDAYDEVLNNRRALLSVHFLLFDYTINLPFL